MNRASIYKRSAQRGVAAVEFAVIASLLLVLLSVPLFFGRLFWHYTAIQKAAHDAAWYLATVSQNDMRNQTRSLDATNVARYIAQSEVGELAPGGDYAPTVTLDCRPLGCGQGAPATVYVRVSVTMFDPIFQVSYAGGDDGLGMYAESEINYVGQ
jgi:Flp pilus assembly protein TadG